MTGATLEAGTPYDFTLTVNELGNAPENSRNRFMSVVVVVDNVAPAFATGAPTSGTVVERASDHEIANLQGPTRITRL